jgi:Kef-type K+ transport system membrane component KefB
MLTALTALLVAAHLFGHALERLHQPRVIGEILGGLVLGPTLMSKFFPGPLGWVIPGSGPVAAFLLAVYQLGLLLLMYCSGTEIRSLFDRSERKTIVGITLGGILVPFGAGLLLLSLLQTRSLEGPHAQGGAFVLVFGIAIAITSIPVISRILFDLGIIGTSFARIVLSAAVAEDVLLYVVLAVALGLAQGSHGSSFALSMPFGPDPASSWNIGYHVIAEGGFLLAAVLLGPAVLGRALRSRHNILGRSNPVAFQLAFMLGLSVLCVVLGIAPLFGAFVGGIVTGSSRDEDVIQAQASIRRFSFAFFIPCYFALVGFQLDLVKDLDILFFLGFLAFATLTKATSVYVGARLSGERHLAAMNLAAAMNARGGPGIVLASTAFEAGIIDRSFFASLVMLSVITSLLAGAWLGRILKKGLPLRGASSERRRAGERVEVPAEVPSVP